MSKDKKSIFNAKLSMSDTTHGTLLLVIGAYLVYLAYGMVQDTLSGASSMSMTITAILAGLMGLAGLAVAIFGAVEALKSWKASRKAGSGESADEE